MDSDKAFKKDADSISEQGKTVEPLLPRTPLGYEPNEDIHTTMYGGPRIQPMYGGPYGGRGNRSSTLKLVLIVCVVGGIILLAFAVVIVAILLLLVRW